MELEPFISELANRANVMHRSFRDKPIIIYDDHRWLLNVLFKLYQSGELASPDLIYLDHHEDYAESLKKTELLSKIGVTDLEDATDKQFGAFVDYDLRTDDSDWLRTALELNLVKDVALFGGSCNDELRSGMNQYESEDGILHKVFKLSEDIEFEIGCRGQLGDHARSAEFADVRKFFKSGEYSYDGLLKSGYILDFDLDFFSIYSKECQSLAWPGKVFDDKLGQHSKSFRLIHQLILNAAVITICREPDFCGGIGESNSILEQLDCRFFNGSLGTEPAYRVW